MATSPVEDSLKAIFVAEQHVPGSLATTGRIAHAVNVTPGAASRILVETPPGS